jgi:hypothetical protein
MIVNGKLPDFACNVISKGQITLGDVRRLQRSYLPGGITNREELEIGRNGSSLLLPISSSRLKHMSVHSKMPRANGSSSYLLRPPLSWAYGSPDRFVVSYHVYELAN